MGEKNEMMHGWALLQAEREDNFLKSKVMYLIKNDRTVELWVCVDDPRWSRRHHKPAICKPRSYIRSKSLELTTCQILYSMPTPLF